MARYWTRVLTWQYRGRMSISNFLNEDWLIVSLAPAAPLGHPPPRRVQSPIANRQLKIS